MKEELFTLLVSTLIRGALLLLAAPLLLRLLRRSTAALRHQVCAWILLLAGLLPVAGVILPPWKVVPRSEAAMAVFEARAAPVELARELPPAAWTDANPQVEGPNRTEPSIALENERTSSLPLAKGSKSEPASFAFARDWKTWLAGLWAFGLITSLGGLGWGIWRVRRATSRAEDWDPGRCLLMTLGAPSRMKVKVSPEGAGPLIWGFWRPVVVLPAAAREWTGERLRVVLGHELTHVRRHDCAVHLAAAFCASLHWCNPLAWWVLRRLLREAEHACDDSMLEAAGGGTPYAEHLLAVAADGRAIASVAPSMARPSALRQRVAAVLDASVSRRPLSQRVKLLAGAAALALGLPVALAQVNDETPKSTIAQVPPKDEAGSKTEKPKPPLITVVVSTVDENDRPLAGVILKLLDLDKRGALDPLQPDAEAETGADGQVEMKLPAGYYQVLATKDKLAVGEEHKSACFWRLPAKAPRKDVRLVLKPAIELELRVVETGTGKAVPGARAILENGLTGIGDAEGKVLLTQVPAGKHNVKVHAPPLADRIAAFNTDGKPRVKLTVEMLPGFEVTGQVRDADGHPVKDALVRDYYSGYYAHTNMRRCLTDAEGRYQLGWYPKDKPLWSLGVEHPDYAKVTRSNLPAPTKGRTARLDFTIDVGREIRGVVRDPEGQPVAKALVRFSSSPSYVYAWTNAQGEFRLTKIGTDRSDVVLVLAAGFAPAFVEATPGQEQALAFDLKPELKVAGQVKDRSGKPLAGIIIAPLLQMDGHSYDYLGSEVTSDENGRFELPQVAAEGMAVDVYRTGYSAVRQQTFDPGKPLEIVLDAEGVLAGRVIDAETRKPVPAFNVRLGIAEGKRAEGEPFGTFSSYLGDRGQDCQAEDGRFGITDLNTRAHYRVHVTAAGYVPHLLEKVLCLPADDPQWPVTIELRRGNLRDIRVKDAQTGQPLAGVDVLWHENPAHLTRFGDVLSLNRLNDFRWDGDYKDLAHASSGKDGSVQIRCQVPADKPLALILRKEGYVPVYLTGMIGAAGDYSLQREATLRLNLGALKTTDGKLTAQLYCGNIGHDYLQVSPEGILQEGGLSGGKAYLHLDDSAGTLLSAVLDLKPGQLNAFELKDLESVPLKVKVLLDDQPAKAEVRLRENKPDSRYFMTAYAWGRTNSTGEVLFPHLPKLPFEIEVLVQEEGFKPGEGSDAFSREIDLSAPDGNTEQVFRFVSAPK